MAKDTSGPAFPTTEYFDEKPIGVYAGMSLRDYFAAKAMQSIFVDGQTWSRKTTYTDAAERAYLMADEMLKARRM